MAINILDIQPTKVTRDLRNKYLLIAAEPKFGKTTFASSIPGVLVLAFDPGLNASGGVMSQKISKWTDFKLVLRQLDKDAAKERYSTIALDTVTIAAELCIEYICSEANANALGDIPYGKLYDLYEKEFGRALRSIAMMGYGLTMTCHIDVKEVLYKGEKIDRIQPALDKRALKVVNSLVDIIGIGVIEYDEDDQPHRVLYSGKSPYMLAGTRFAYFPEKIPYGYKEVRDALVEAIELEGSNNGGFIADLDDTKTDTDVPFSELQDKARELWRNLVEINSDNSVKILDQVENIFGVRKKLSDITLEEYDQFVELVKVMEKIT